RAFATTCNAANDRAECRATTRAHGRVFRPAAGFDIALFVNRLHLLAFVEALDLRGEASALAVAQLDAIESQGQFGLAGQLARLVQLGDVTGDDGVGIFRWVEHNGREAVAFPVGLGADGRLQADLHFDAVTHDHAIL